MSKKISFNETPSRLSPAGDTPPQIVQLPSLVTPSSDEIESHKPSAYYFRRALRTAHSREHAIVIGLSLSSELERLTQWAEEQGLNPPQWIADPDEAREKGWLHEA